MRAAYVLSVIIAGLAATTAQAADPSWHVSELTDHIYGGRLRLAEIDGQAVQAVVRCSAGLGYAEVRFFLDQGLVTGSDTVRWQFNGGPVRSAAWSKSANGRSLLVPASLQARFLDRLKSRRRLTLYLKDADGSKHTLAVPLRGSARAITIAMQDCTGR